jgi:hypothetical protein
MSRLDDELKIAFQRQEPSADFAARVLARINEAPAPQAKPTMWQRLAGVFAMPALRYAAAGAMALLLIIIGVALLRSQRTAGVDNNPPQVAGPSVNPSSTAPGADQTTAKKNGAESHAGSRTPDGSTKASTGLTNGPTEVRLSPRTGGSRRVIHHHAHVVARQLPPSAEAEAAKEKVLFALQITSEALNGVQRAISDDRPNDEKPEPVHNR